MGTQLLPAGGGADPGWDKAPQGGEVRKYKSQNEPPPTTPHSVNPPPGLRAISGLVAHTLRLEKGPDITRGSSCRGKYQYPQATDIEEPEMECFHTFSR